MLLSAQATTQEIAEMTSAFSKLTMHTDQHPGRGIEIRSPVSGLVSAPDAPAGPVYLSGLMPDAVQVQLQGHQLVAPFSGIVTSADRGGHRILLHYQRGERQVAVQQAEQGLLMLAGFQHQLAVIRQ